MESKGPRFFFSWLKWGFYPMVLQIGTSFKILPGIGSMKMSWHRWSMAASTWSTIFSCRKFGTFHEVIGSWKMGTRKLCHSYPPSIHILSTPKKKAGLDSKFWTFFDIFFGTLTLPYLNLKERWGGWLDFAVIFSIGVVVFSVDWGLPWNTLVVH